MLTSWPAYALAVIMLAGFTTEQVALAAGPLTASMTAETITDPLTGYFLGIVGYGEPLPDAGAPRVLGFLGLLMVVLGAAALARSPLLQGRDVDRRPATTSTASAPAVGHESTGGVSEPEGATPESPPGTAESGDSGRARHF